MLHAVIAKIQHNKVPMDSIYCEISVEKHLLVLHQQCTAQSLAAIFQLQRNISPEKTNHALLYKCILKDCMYLQNGHGFCARRAAAATTTTATTGFSGHNLVVIHAFDFLVPIHNVDL